MTEDELRRLPEFGNLPIYAEDDERCNGLMQPDVDGFDGSIRESDDDVEFYELLRNNSYKLAGAIRYSNHAGPTRIRSIFWQRR